MALFKRKNEKDNKKKEAEKKETKNQKPESKNLASAKTNTKEASKTSKKETAKTTTKKTEKKAVEKQTTSKTKEDKTKKPIYRVVYDKDSRLWLIKKDGAKRTIASFVTKDEALERVKDLSEINSMSFVVHKKDGKFQKK